MLQFLLNSFYYTQHVLDAIICFFSYIKKVYILRLPVSYPGDPIPNPLLRRGKWLKKAQYQLQGEWLFACDQESHRITEEYITPSGYKLTGESAGRQIWYCKPDGLNNTQQHSFNASVNPNSGDKLLRSMQIQKWKGKKPDETNKPTTAKQTAIKGMEFYQMIQCDDGHWAGDYGGPNFLMPGLIIALYITKAPFPEWRKHGMITYLKNHQQEDGGWGTHIECASTMFGTILSYVSLRLLGESADQEHMKLAHQFITKHGGALYAPSWAKFWLAVLGVYEWDGINSIPAELWYLPRWFPFHPGKLWCHCRMVYLPMCYVYCKRFQPDIASNPIILELRKELYSQEYAKINWDSYRQTCADIDVYSPLNPILKISQDFLSVYERVLPYIYPLKWLREKALGYVISYIHAEDIQTNFVDIGPVNKALNLLSVWIDAKQSTASPEFQNHLLRVDDYLWCAEDGVKMQGYNGSQCWDTSFAIQAIVEGKLSGLFPECTRKVYSYLDRTQIKEDEDNRELYFRHISKGGWPFSTAAHGWPISDCTAEGLKAVLALHKDNSVIPLESRISKERLQDAVDVILSYHNKDGGWATYENNRGYGWYELLNPSEVFGDIMIDYSYVECSSACITALKSFSKLVPDYRSKEVLNAIQAGRKFLKSIQRADGSWYGSWGVCFTYGTWFGIEGLITAGEETTSPAVEKAVSFLLSKQNSNGGWGESYVACVDKAYPVDGTGCYGDSQSGVVQTAWAVLGLLIADCKDKAAIDKGVKYILSKQLSNGDWDQEGITGVFNRSCGITYTAYRNVFPIWALVRYANKYE